jgi:membrane associated rhomboid family serine protease
MHNEWWRMFTPVFLHVGVIHLSLNVFCQLNAVAMFEREWGWRKWLIIFTCSTIGCQTFSNFFDQETIAVGSSGTLMGMFAGKLAHVFVFSFFDIVKNDVDEAIRMDQLSSVLCGLTIESFLGAFTYIEWSGNMGGLLCGFLSGMVVFSGQIYGCCTRFWTATISFLALIASIGAILYKFIEEAEPDEQLDNVCEYFRSFFPEGYECGCMWQ